MAKPQLTAPLDRPGTGGRLIYAIGDIHGRADLLHRLLQKIAEDLEQRPRAKQPLLVFLGDYVDRGPQSLTVIDKILALQESGVIATEALKGNHEEAVLSFLADPTFGPLWVQHGGGPTLASYGVRPPLSTRPADWIAAQAAFIEALPRRHLEFLSNLSLTHQVGDYLFVHAGVRPGVPLERQTERDLLWIRDDFLSAAYPSDYVVVHGHTPAPRPVVGPGRIGVDTGAYATGVLTAVCLSDFDQTFIQVSARR